jgi:hypothetical protein
VLKLIAELEARSFVVREKASAELERLGELAAADLRKALAGQPSLELRRRVETLLGRLRRPPLSAEPLRQVRAVEVLERVGSAEAKRLLETLAGGAPGVRLTEEARAALKRLPR